MMTNKEIAINKLMNLKNALEACGIEADYYMDDEGTATVRAALWSCQDGKMLDFGASAEPMDDYETIYHYIDPNCEV